MIENKGRIKVISIVGAVWVVASALVFLLVVDEPTPVQRAAFRYLIFIEVLVAVILAMQDYRPGPAATRVGFYVSSLVYLMLAAGIAIIHMTGIIHVTAWLHVGQLILLAALITILILFSRGGGEAETVNSIKAWNASGVQGLLSRLEVLAASKAIEAPDKTILKKLTDDVRFFDLGNPTPSDSKIEAKVSQLEAIVNSNNPAALDGAGLGGLVDELHTLVTLRRQESSARNRGGF